jgi:hypothetical protein
LKDPIKMFCTIRGRNVKGLVCFDTSVMKNERSGKDKEGRGGDK